MITVYKSISEPEYDEYFRITAEKQKLEYEAEIKQGIPYVGMPERPQRIRTQVTSPGRTTFTSGTMTTSLITGKPRITIMNTAVHDNDSSGKKNCKTV